MSDIPRRATPHQELIEQLMDSRVPKNEREHAAAREIERLRGLVYAVPPTEHATGQTWKEACEANRDEVARLDNLLRTYRLPDEVVDIKVVIELRAEIKRLREENALLTKGWQPATPTALLDEIKRLRELLGETYGYIHIPYGASHEDVAEISDVRQRVREALGERDD